MKKYLIFAASALALASCSSDDFLGDNPGNVQNATTAINFGGEAGKITRATSNTGTPQKMLDGQFKVYGVKKVSDGKLKSVFPNYYVWYVEGKNTTSNTDGWEYVGTKGATNLGIGNITLNTPEDQTIKYWDYSASEYRFVAGSPIGAFNYKVPVLPSESKEILSATVTGFAGHINANNTTTKLNTDPIYIADPVKVVKDNYKDPVTFTFKRQQSMVRVGLYETIPGYFVSDVHFYTCDDAGNLTASESNNIILTSSTADYFVGGKEIEGTVTYKWDDTPRPSYTFAYTDNANLEKSKNWYAGKLEALAETSTAQVDHLYGTDGDMSETGYFTVLPTQAETASPILIKCDYTLNAPESGETIKVTGATAAIPAAFSKWEANTRYTYLFKISDNTNGTTGTPGTTDPAGLFPITFKAMVTETLDGTEGTTTTVATPSITTYQEGSVTKEGIEYKTGKPIYATVYDEETKEFKNLNTDGTAGNVQVYKLSKERTEAELQVAAVANDEFKDANKVTSTEVPATAFGNLEANKYLKFTPTEAAWYAIQYKYADDAYKYKVFEVKAPTVTPAP